MPKKIFVKVQWEFPTAGHLVFWKPYPWVKILKNMLDASAENLSTTTRNLYLESLGISEQTLNTLVRFQWKFVWILIGSRLSVSELEYFLSVENIEISLYAQARQSLLLLTQGNIYNRLRFLNKYLMFLEELNELFRENWSKFLTSGYLVFWKQFRAAGYLDTSKHQRYVYPSAGSQSLSFDFSNSTYF